ncbi:unnamed protein product [Soboliphyme baturini]|uniref:Peptidase_M1_N domain-containing protein n=1 Tax=Soboliphyme baturini TaxID=241478 RepID=A0A183J985_9BILA|nr:unnamed protein product [Soboliphyme baturini]
MARKVSVSYTGLALLSIFVVACFLAIGLGVYYGTRTDGGEKPDSVSTSATPFGTTSPVDGVSTKTVSSTTTEPIDRTKWRLPKTVFPLKYQLTIQPFFPPKVLPQDPRCFTFNADLTITLICRVPTNQVVLNMRNLDLDIEQLSFKDSSGAVIPFANDIFLYEPFYERVTFFLSKTLKAGQKYTFFLKYRGYLGNDLQGFYRSSYIEKNQTKWLVVTTFECCSARRALPCFDEPEFKAVFGLTMIHPVNMVALFNNEHLYSVDYG